MCGIAEAVDTIAEPEPLALTALNSWLAAWAGNPA
jgi:hypothetical protein